MNYQYLIVKCVELDDQFECDCDRTVVCMTNHLGKYKKIGYEIYELLSDGTFKCIKNYDDKQVKV